MYSGRNLRRKFLYGSAACALLAASLLYNAPLSAQMAGQKIEEAVMRRLEKEPRGQTGDLTTSQAVLFMYKHLEPLFRQSLREVQDARKVADNYQRRMPRTSAEWGQYIDAVSAMQTGREKYQQALRNVVAERRPIIGRLLGGRIKSTVSNIDRISGEQAAELGALVDVQRQILQQEGRIRSQQMPTIVWPPAIDPFLQEEIEATIESALKNQGGDAYAAWRALERRLARLRRDLEAAADELRLAAHANWNQLSDMEKRAMAELNVLAEAQVDLASNAMFQQTTIRRVYMAQQTFGVWRELN